MVRIGFGSLLMAWGVYVITYHWYNPTSEGAQERVFGFFIIVVGLWSMIKGVQGVRSAALLEARQHGQASVPERGPAHRQSEPVSTANGPASVEVLADAHSKARARIVEAVIAGLIVAAISGGAAKLFDAL
jgi:hypothetical protein